MSRFLDRRDAGRQLAKRLQRFSGRSDVIVVALPRDAVQVAATVARALKAPLEVLSAAHPLPDLRGYTALIVDDSLTSIDAMSAAVGQIKACGAERVVVAAPVGRADLCATFRVVADDCVLALAPFPLRRLSDWYVDADDDVLVAAPVVVADRVSSESTLRA